MKQYRIAWRAIKTDATGYGTGLFTKEEAEKIAEGLNKEDEFTIHWAELASEKEPKEKND